MTPSHLSRRGFLGAAAAAAAASGPCRADDASPNSASRTLPLRRDIPRTEPRDVVVCGGGPAGVAAALAARRAGAQVLLVEAMGQLGGMGVSGLVSHWLGGRTSDCSKWVVGGLFRALSEEAAKAGFALLPSRGPKYQPHGWYGGLAHGIPFDPFRMAAFLDAKMATAGVEVLLLTDAIDVEVHQGRISHVVVSNKSGLAAVPSKAVIDATGDADIAARSGCRVEKGRAQDGLTTPTTLIFHVDQVDQDALADHINEHNAPRFRKKIQQLRAGGHWPFPYDIFISVQLVEKGTMMINTSRLVGIDGTDGVSKSRGMVRGRAETLQLMEVMRKHFPGFAGSRLKAVAPLLGVRETRRIRGAFQLTVRDLTEGRQFDDTIGLSSYGWDLPDPKRPSHNPSHGRKRPTTPIPYRIMIPAPIENLLCPGRAVSVERAVLGPLRVAAPCFAMGEAAGEAAARVAGKGIAFGDVDVAALRESLAEHGAVLTV